MFYRCNYGCKIGKNKSKGSERTKGPLYTLMKQNIKIQIQILFLVVRSHHFIDITQCPPFDFVKVTKGKTTRKFQPHFH